MAPILFLAAVFLIFVVWWIAMIRNRATFQERFPPISDAEFLARCRPGTNPEVALKVRKMVAEYFALEYERVYPSMTFIEDIGAD